jgi:hypothetical protein
VPVRSGAGLSGNEETYPQNEQIKDNMAPGVSPEPGGSNS